MSKSAASRHWIEATAAKVAELRERELRGTEFSASCSMASRWRINARVKLTLLGHGSLV
jgi:hypothetical protein